MISMRKVYPLVLILTLAASSLLMVQAISAQTIPQPSVPEFTIEYVDRSYTVPANYSYGTNPYNGEQIKTGHGYYRVDNETIELTIKNQPSSSYKDPDRGWPYLLCYNVSWKGHYEDTWRYWGYYMDSMSPHYDDSVWYLHRASDSEYTIFIFGFGTDRESTNNMPNLGKLPANTQIDFRVQALFGYYNEVMVDWVPGFRPSYKFVFTGESSHWSSVQTIALHESKPTPAPTNTQSPSSTAMTTPTQNPLITPIQPETQTGAILSLDWKDIVIAVIATAFAITVILIVLLRRRWA